MIGDRKVKYQRKKTPVMSPRKTTLMDSRSDRKHPDLYLDSGIID